MLSTYLTRHVTPFPSFANKRLTLQHKLREIRRQEDSEGEHTEAAARLQRDHQITDQIHESDSGVLINEMDDLITMTKQRYLQRSDLVTDLGHRVSSLLARVDASDIRFLETLSYCLLSSSSVYSCISSFLSALHHCCKPGQVRQIQTK